MGLRLAYRLASGLIVPSPARSAAPSCTLRVPVRIGLTALPRDSACPSDNDLITSTSYWHATAHSPHSTTSPSTPDPSLTYRIRRQSTLYLQQLPDILYFYFIRFVDCIIIRDQSK